MLFRSLIRSKSQERKYGELIEDLILRIDHSLDHSVSVFDWKEWGKFVFSHSKDIEFGDQTELMSRVMQFCDQKSVAIERSVDVSSEIEFWAEQIDDLGSTWKIDASPFVNRLKSAAHELRQSEPTESDSDKYERPSERPDDSDSDTAIGRLFESLRSGRN